MSRRHNDGQQYRDHHQHGGHQRHYSNQKPAREMTREELGNALDERFSNIGLVIAGIYKTLTTAMVALPNMELHTRQFCVSVGDDGISVCVHPNGGYGDGRDDYDDNDNDDEEGHIYDGD